ncbi:putative reverse transcriptase domain-containing protein [Tanacetum coccineum]
MIICDKKIVRIPLCDETLTIRSNRSDGYASIVASEQRAKLFDRIAMLERDNMRLRGMLGIERHRVDRLRRSMSDYDCEIRYHPGKANIIADALSRKEQVKPLKENLHGMDKEFENRLDGTLCIRSRMLDMFEDEGRLSGVIRFTGTTKNTSLEMGKYSHGFYHKPAKDNTLLLHDLGNRDHQKNYANVGTVAYRLELLEQLSRVHSTFRVSNLKKCLSDETQVISLDEIQIDDTLYFIEEPFKIMDREVKHLKQSRILIVKFCWNSRRGPASIWEREDQFQKKYPFDHLFVHPNPLRPSTVVRTYVIIQFQLLSSPVTALIEENLEAEKLYNVDQKLEVLSHGVIYLKGRAWIPKVGNLREVILDEAHRSRYLIHPGADKMYQDIKEYYSWPCMNKDIALYVGKCLTYAKVKDALNSCMEVLTIDKEHVEALIESACSLSYCIEDWEGSVAVMKASAENHLRKDRRKICFARYFTQFSDTKKASQKAMRGRSTKISDRKSVAKSTAKILGVAWYKGNLLKGKFCFIQGDDYISTSGEALAL